MQSEELKGKLIGNMEMKLYSYCNRVINDVMFFTQIGSDEGKSTYNSAIYVVRRQLKLGWVNIVYCVDLSLCCCILWEMLAALHRPNCTVYLIISLWIIEVTLFGWIWSHYNYYVFVFSYLKHFIYLKPRWLEVWPKHLTT